MSDLLLTHGYFLFEDEKELQIMKPYPPLGLLYISGFLRREGFDVEVFDTTFKNRSELFSKLERDSGVLGIYTNLMTRGSALSVIAKAKSEGWIVVLGGPEPANYPEEYLNHGADVVIVGEGEETMRELLPALSENGPHRIHEVSGAVFRNEEGRIVTNAAREQIAVLDSIPWPDREQIDISRYVDVWREHHGTGSVNLITARGCPYTCRWCSHSVFGFTHRRRSVLDCADEVEHIKDRYKPDQVWYSDDVFTIHHGWLHKYATELERRNLRLPFETISRADRLMKEEVLETLSKMGCYRVWIGSESGSQRILDAMSRGVKTEQVEWAVKAAQRHGIEVGMFLMWGYEDESADDIAATIEHVKRCNPNIFFTTVAYPIKNTDYYKRVADQVVLEKDWATATDRDYMIRGRHSRSYYKQADLWLRNEVEAARLEQEDPLEAQARLGAAVRARDSMRALGAEVEV